MNKFILITIFIALPVFVFAQTNLGGTNLSLDTIYVFFSNVADYIFTGGTILIGIAFVLTGVMFFTAGGDSAKVKKAKDMFVATLIGALIIFGVGTILVTIELFATGGSGLFGGGGDGGSNYCAADPFGSGFRFCSHDQSIVCTNDAQCN